MTAAEVTGWLDRLAETHEAATPGPWVQSQHGDDRYVAGDFTPDGLFCVDVAVCPADTADAAAIVAAHNATPALIAAVRAVLTEAEALDRFADAVPYAATGSYDDGRKRAQANAAARIRGAVAAALGAEVTGR